MAGNYPDVPGHRMAFDRDGTVGFYIEDGVSTQLSQSEMEAMNDETNSAVYDVFMNNPPLRRWGVIFPEERDVVGHYLAARATDGPLDSLQTSPDTTNGLDGTWTGVPGIPGEDDSPTPAKMRNDIIGVSWSGVLGVRFRLGGGGNAVRVSFRAWHLYGSPSSGAADDRLRFWHPTSDAEVDGAYLDWGDIERVSTNTRDIRIKNPSSQTAENVTLTTEILTDTTPSVPDGYTFSDGGDFVGSLNIGDISAGAISGVVTVRRTVPSDATLSLWWPRIVASASSWT